MKKYTYEAEGLKVIIETEKNESEAWMEVVEKLGVNPNKCILKKEEVIKSVGRPMAGDRMCVQIMKRQGLTQEKISHILGISISTVRRYWKEDGNK